MFEKNPLLLNLDTNSNETLIATLFEIHDNMEDFTQSVRTFISNLSILIQPPQASASYFTKLITQLFFYDKASGIASF